MINIHAQLQNDSIIDFKKNRRLKLFVGCNQRNLVKVVTKNIADENLKILTEKIHIKCKNYNR